MKNLLCIAVLLLAIGAAGTPAKAHGPYVAYYGAPLHAAPAPVVVTSYYAPAPVVAYQPVPVYRTRYRPILGGTVTRVHTGYMPVVYGY